MLVWSPVCRSIIAYIHNASTPAAVVLVCSPEALSFSARPASLSIRIPSGTAALDVCKACQEALKRLAYEKARTVHRESIRPNHNTLLRLVVQERVNRHGRHLLATSNGMCCESASVSRLSSIKQHPLSPSTNTIPLQDWLPRIDLARALKAANRSASVREPRATGGGPRNQHAKASSGRNLQISLGDALLLNPTHLRLARLWRYQQTRAIITAYSASFSVLVPGLWV